jgi:hypothetical protein
MRDERQIFRVDVFKLFRDELSVAINMEGMILYAKVISAEALTVILRERFGFDDRRLCDLGTQLAAQGRAVVALFCTKGDLRGAQFIPS